MTEEIPGTKIVVIKIVPNINPKLPPDIKLSRAENISGKLELAYIISATLAKILEDKFNEEITNNANRLHTTGKRN